MSPLSSPPSEHACDAVTVVIPDEAEKCPNSDLRYNESSSLLPLRSYRLYPTRYIVLTAFCLLSCVNAWIWITWSPVAAQAASFWAVEETDVDALASAYMYIYVPFSFLSLSLLKKHGLRFGLMAASALNLLGALVRYVGLRSYGAVYAGTVLCAIAQTFSLAMPPLISGNWFGADERGVATAIGVLSNQVGIAIGLGATVCGDYGGNDKEELVFKLLAGYVIAQLIVSVLAALLVVTCVTADEPPTPPSAAAATLKRMSTADCSDYSWDQEIGYHIEETSPLAKEPGKESSLTSNARNTVYEASHQGCYGSFQTRESDSLKKTTQPDETNASFNDAPASLPDYMSSLKLFICNPSSAMYAVCYGLGVGVYYTVPTFLSQFVPHWNGFEVGVLGICFVVAGILGSAAIGHIIDVTNNQHRRVSLLVLVSAAASMMLFLFSMYQQQRQEWSTEELEGIINKFNVYLSTSLTGFFLAALIPAGFEYGSAMAYPADEAAVAGVLECAAQISGFLLVTEGASLRRGVGVTFIAIMEGTLLFAMILMVFGVTASSRRPS